MKNILTGLLLCLVYPICLFATKTDFTPIPEDTILGYWENWDTSIRLTDIPPEYNIIAIAFMLAEDDSFTPYFQLDASCYLYGNGGGTNGFKADIKTLQSSQRPVIISIGGGTSTFIIDSQIAEDTFVTNVINIIDEYNFDGIDIDFEGDSMNFKDASNPGSFNVEDLSPQLQHTISAFKRIHDHYGSDFILTAAPEIAYVQYGGISGYYAGYTKKEGSFLPILDNLRDEFDLINIQYYNYGKSTWIPYIREDASTNWDGYTAGTIDALAQLLDYFLYGFDIPNLNIHFDAYPPEKVGIGLPASPSSAGTPISSDPDGYYMQTNEVFAVMDYIMQGIKDDNFIFNMTDNKIYPGLRGLMTWSINHDASTADESSEYEFCYSYSQYFNALNSKDSNGNSIPDRWELTYFNDLNVDESSICSNGINTILEAYIAGINPTNKTSFFYISQFSRSPYNTIAWNSYPGRTYSILASTNLTDQFNIVIASNLLWNYSVYTDSFYSSEAKIFYKINVKLEE